MIKFHQHGEALFLRADRIHILMELNRDTDQYLLEQFRCSVTYDDHGERKSVFYVDETPDEAEALLK